MKKAFLVLLVLFSMVQNLIASDMLPKGQPKPKIKRALYIRPQIKLGKMENGNGFSEIQYVKFEYDFTQKYTIEGGVSTGFTSPRNSQLRYNHAVNRLGIKFTYRPFDDLGFFFEGSLTDNIDGATNPASYFVYDNYQAVGVNWNIKTFTFE